MKKIAAFFTGLTLTLALAACTTPPADTGTDTETPENGGQMESSPAAEAPVTIDMQYGGMFFAPDSITVQRGQEVTINLQGAGTHTFTIDELGINVPLSGSADESVTFTPEQAGTYAFYCAIPGHRQQGMEGTLIVTE